MRSLLSTIFRIGSFLGMAGMALVVVLLAVNIVIRPFGLAIPSVDDFVAIFLVMAFTFGLVAAAGEDEHLSITVLTDRLAGNLRMPLLRITQVVTAVVVCFMAYGLGRMFLAAVKSNQMMLGAVPIPRFVPIGMGFAGMAFFAAALVLKLALDLGSRSPSSSLDNGG